MKQLASASNGLVVSALHRTSQWKSITEIAKSVSGPCYGKLRFYYGHCEVGTAAVILQSVYK